MARSNNRGEVSINASDLFARYPTAPLPGYHSVREVAKFLGASVANTNIKLRDSGLPSMRVKPKQHIVTYYKVELA